ncbi:MAG: serine/threonine dehydratase [Candidatus Entotheonella factor]|uniref:Serine/threonine dehydratase n=1 Tax=Entotheonella factor TaxID=1429438 RepID=W4LKA9_ENTF1|nr:MAG: serine/threonine dehydratase [Candidatus Entotheonella factor]
MPLPTIDDVRQAAARIKPYVHHTPVLTCTSLDHMAHAQLFFKCENFQKVGAFKFRGACNIVFSLSEADAQRGVATHSSGNHGAALAHAAQLRNIPAHIVMPHNVPQVKRDAIAGYGAHIIWCEPSQADREATVKRVVDETGAVFAHPSNDALVIAGQGTAALELLDDVSELDMVLAPIGGGGLTSGLALAISACSPRTMVAVEPAGADDAYRSLQSGTLQPSVNPQTIADGLRTSLGDLTFPLIQQHVEQIVTVSEEAIIRAMRHVWERMKIVIEPSSAVPVAAVLDKRIEVSGLRVGIVLSGGNVDLASLPF